MRELFSCNRQGSAKFNEDVVGHHQNVAWVIDGATPLFPNLYISNENDVVWMVHQINDQMARLISDDISLEEILSRTLNKVNQVALEINPHLNEIVGYELPTFTIAMVRFLDQTLEYYVLGDSGILIESEGNPTYITDRRLDIFGEEIEEEIKRRNSSSNIDKLQEIRKHLNKEHGYWIGSLDGEGVPYGLTGELPVNEHSKALCFTDGYSRIFELYKRMDVQQFQFGVDFVQQSVDFIREIEEEDRDCSVYERAKKSDDLSVILVENKI